MEVVILPKFPVEAVKVAGGGSAKGSMKDRRRRKAPRITDMEEASWHGLLGNRTGSFESDILLLDLD